LPLYYVPRTNDAACKQLWREDGGRSHIDDRAEFEDRVAKLDASIFRSIARRHQLSIEAGRAFIELKKLLPHGKWERRLKGTFGPHGISLRTAERWMDRARRHDRKARNDKVALLKSGSDDDAKDVKRATQRAQAEQPKKQNTYELPLTSLNSEDRKAVDTLRKTSKWPKAERKIVEEVQRQCLKYGAYEENDQEKNNEDDSAHA
jgi:hypothetical protein